MQNRFFLHFKSKGFFEKNTFVSLENNQLTIAFASYLEENPQVLIYDVLGRVITPVGNANFDGFEWNAQLPALPHQVLLVKISSALGVETQKMVR